MSRPRVKTIRAVTRAVEVLQIVQASGGVSLNDIHRELGLPKATLLRILLNLQDAGLVWQRMTRRVDWPSILAVPRVAFVQVGWPSARRLLYRLPELL